MFRRARLRVRFACVHVCIFSGQNVRDTQLFVLLGALLFWGFVLGRLKRIMHNAERKHTHPYLHARSHTHTHIFTFAHIYVP
jgi:hypothetical protein